MSPFILIMDMKNCVKKLPLTIVGGGGLSFSTGATKKKVLIFDEVLWTPEEEGLSEWPRCEITAKVAHSPPPFPSRRRDWHTTMTREGRLRSSVCNQCVQNCACIWVAKRRAEEKKEGAGEGNIWVRTTLWAWIGWMGIGKIRLMKLCNLRAWIQL